ncbi:MAG: hypothetical protein KME15_25590 [Drouetiella hepatica Uher 2000/2452]|jgi:hypothetical protein|uniref:Transposase n=1 Tax=Drouetiella hepatica Uher 2000/2452 TaxID=904376 RepID=A0A951UQ71_9CYAN|nr:hypothetical protein [Drouetiella hepatica Uher 2000/2452]
MPRRTPAQQLIAEIHSWETEHLIDLRDMLTGLIEAQQQPVTLAVADRRPDGSEVGVRGGTGHIELKMIPDRKSGKSYGPYKYLRYRGITKRGAIGLKSVYLGKALPSTTETQSPAIEASTLNER